jgi:hypothetical protein
MADKKKGFPLGELNPSPFATKHRPISRNTVIDSPEAASAALLNNLVQPDLFEETSVFKAVIVDVRYSPANSSPLGHLIASVLGRAAPNPSPEFTCMIPEIHAHLPNPLLEDDYSKRKRLISYYPKFHYSDLDNVGHLDFNTWLPGSIVEIEFADQNYNFGFVRSLIRSADNTDSSDVLLSNAQDIWASADHPVGSTLLGNNIGQSPQDCKEPRTAEDILRAYGSVGSKFMNIEIAQKIVDVAESVGMGDPGWLANVIYFETARSFDPGKFNPKTEAIKAGTGASGLIQFIPSTAKNLGTTIADLRKMDSLEQLNYVQKYFSSYSGRLNSQSDVLAAVFFPKAIGNPGFNIYEYYVNEKGKAWADKNYLEPNNGIIYMQEYANSATAAAKLKCREDTDNA